MEREALAIADTLDKASFFILGCIDQIITVKQKPLLKVFGDQSLEDISDTTG